MAADRAFRVAIVLAAAALAFQLASCRKGAKGEAAPARPVNAALALDYPGTGDSGRNDLAWKGFMEAAKAAGAVLTDGRSTYDFGDRGRMLCLAPKAAGRDRAQVVRTMAEAGYGVVILAGEAYADAVKRIAPEYPQAIFAILDASPREDFPGNTRFVEFESSQCAYLAGVLAASVSPADDRAVLGFVSENGDAEADALLGAWRAGSARENPAFAQAARTPARTLTPDWVEGKKLKKGLGADEAFSQLDKAGASAVFWAAGAPGPSILEKAKASGIWLVRYPLDAADAPAVLASAVKRYDRAVGLAVSRFSGTEPPGGNLKLGLKDGGVELVVGESARNIADPKRPELEKAAAALLTGPAAYGP